MLGESRPGSRPEVRALEGRDAAATAALHARELPEGFFAQLGERFLSAYHRSFAASPHAVALVGGRDGAVEGFLLGVLAPGPHGAYVLRRWGWRLSWLAVRALLARPRLLALFLRTRVRRYARGVWRRRQARPEESPVTAGQWAVLSHVAVGLGYQGSGAGAALVRCLHTTVTEAGAAGVVLLTAAEGPGPAFYRRLGYVVEGEVLGADGQRWLRCRWTAA